MQAEMYLYRLKKFFFFFFQNEQHRPYLVTDVLRCASSLCTVHCLQDLGDQDTGVVF